MPEDDSQLSVLVIDDDVEMCRLITRILHTEGHQVVTAQSAEEGLEHLPYFTFQVAFLDHKLPGMEGFVLGEYLRRHNPHMEIALVTGESDDRLMRMTRAHGIRFISKPFEVNQILDVVAEYLRSAEERKTRKLQEVDPEYAPPIAEHYEGLPAYFSVPSVPRRIEEMLIHKIKLFLNNMASTVRYSERDRVAALAGLMTAQVLGIRLPKHRDGRTFFDAYDDLMIERGRQPAFSSKSAARKD